MKSTNGIRLSFSVYGCLNLLTYCESLYPLAELDPVYSSHGCKQTTRFNQKGIVENMDNLVRSL